MNDMNTSAELSVREIQAITLQRMQYCVRPAEPDIGIPHDDFDLYDMDTELRQPSVPVLIVRADALTALIQSLAAEIERMRGALETVADWRLPPTGEVWPSGAPVSYETNYGSNGARDYFRKLARSALATTQPKG